MTRVLGDPQTGQSMGGSVNPLTGVWAGEWLSRTG
jgi:hypothetical protein